MNFDRETYLLWIDDYRAGILDPAQRRAVEAYLDAHPEDRIELDRDEALLDAFDRLPRPAAPADLRGSVMARLRAERAGGAGEVDGIAAAPGTADVVEIDVRKESGQRETPAARRKGRSGVYRVLQVAAVLVVCVSAWQLTRQSREHAETSVRQKGASDAAVAARVNQPREEGVGREVRESTGLAVAESEAAGVAGAEGTMRISIPESKAKIAAGLREQGVADDEVGRVESAADARLIPLADEGRELAAGESKADAGVTRGVAAKTLDSTRELPVHEPPARGRAVDSDKDVALSWDASPPVATEESAPTGDERFFLGSLAAEPPSAPDTAPKPEVASEMFGYYEKPEKAVKAIEAAKAAESDATVWYDRSGESAAPVAASAPVAVGDPAVAPAQPSADTFGTVMMTPVPSGLELRRIAPALQAGGAPAISPDLSGEASGAIRRDANETQAPDVRDRMEERVSERDWALAKEEQISKAVSPSSPRVPSALEAPAGPTAAGAFLPTGVPASTPAPGLPEKAASTGYPMRGGVDQLSAVASAPTGQTSSPFASKEATAGLEFAVQAPSMSQTLDALQGAVRAGGGNVDETVPGTVPRLRVRFRSGEEMAGLANRLRGQGWRVDETAAALGEGPSGAPGSVSRQATRSAAAPAITPASPVGGVSPVTAGDRVTSDVVAARKSRRTTAAASAAKASPSSASAPASSAPASSAMPAAAARPSPPSSAGGLSVSASSAFGAAPAVPTVGTAPASRVYTVTAPDGGRIVLDARVEP